MDQATLLWIAAVLLTLMGFAGMVLPTIPGPPLLFLGLVAAAWAEGFRYIGFWMLAVLGLMTVLAYGVDFAATAFGAKRFGASPRAAAGAAIGTLVGLFFGLAGILLGPFLGAVIGELSVRRPLKDAGRAGIGATIGLAIGAAVKIALGFAMVGLFITVRFLSDGN
jgi:uncharacterized protein YqgC (DUF456 family)